MNAGNCMKQPLNPGDFHQSYLYGAPHMMPKLPHSHIYSLRSPVISAPLVTHNIVQDLVGQENGNASLGLKMWKQKQEQFACAQAFANQNSTFSYQSLNCRVAQDSRLLLLKSQSPPLNNVMPQTMGDCHLRAMPTENQSLVHKLRVPTECRMEADRTRQVKEEATVPHDSN